MSSSKDITRQVVVVLSAVIAIVGSVIGSGFAGGTPIQNAAGGALSATATPIAPAGGAFSIWSIIYLGLIAYAIWQALPRHRTDQRQRRAGYWVAASLILNAAWILTIQFDQLALSLPIIAALVAVLVRALYLLLAAPPAGRIEAVVIDGTVGLYLGWVCVATAANAAALLRAIGFTGGPIDPTLWAVAIVAVAGVVGILLAVRDRGRIAPTLSLCWGLTWIAVGRLTTGPHSVATAVTALVAVGAVILVTIVLRIRAPRAVQS